MSARFPRNPFFARTINLGLVVSLGIFGCGEARQSQADIEPEPNGTVGTLKVLLANYGDHSETFYRLIKDDGEDVGLNFGDEAPRLRVGERIAVRGEREGNRIQVTGYELVQRRIGDTQQQHLKGAPDPQNLRVAAIGLTTEWSKATLAKRVFQDADSPTAFYKENSYGTWNFTGDAYGPYTIATTSCADSNLYTIASQAAAAAKADGFDPANYENIMYFVPATFNCAWSGVAEVGTNPARTFYNAKHSWYRDIGCVVLAQELGHNYGLLHSHTCTAPPYSNKASWGGTACGGSFSEYGDRYTPMGGGCGHFNSPEMGAMKYIAGCNTLAVTNSGTFEIGPLEQKCAGPQVIRVPIAANVNRGPQYLYVEYRMGKGTVGSDNLSPKGLHFYAASEYGGNATGIQADNRDLDYAVDPFKLREPIGTVDGSWTEPASGVSVTLTAIGQTATVQVTVPSGSGDPTCVGGGTPPATPMCGIVTDGGPPTDTGTGGTGGGPIDASTDVGTGGTAGTGGAAGTSGAAGSGGTAGTAGTAGTGGTGGTAGTGGAAGKGGTGGAAGTGGSSGTGGSTGGAAGTGTGGSAGATGGSAGSSGAAGSPGGKGGSGGTGGGTGGSTTGGTPPGDDGCSCSIPGGNASTRTPAMLLGLSALLPALRRRRRSA
jgi:hypothetical protein